MNPFRRFHGALVAERRTRVLAGLIAELLPQGARVLDVGCGDGRISAEVAHLRPDLDVHGIEVFLREDSLMPITRFDGKRIPYEDDSFDAVVFVDVLHHTEDASNLLKEARRVASKAIVVKDHTSDGWLAKTTLRFMDRTGNPSEGVDFPYNYWSEARWREVFSDLELGIEEWRPRLALYAPPVDWAFGRTLHFVAHLTPPSAW